MRTALFWAVTQRVVVILTQAAHVKGSSLMTVIIQQITIILQPVGVEFYTLLLCNVNQQNAVF